MCETERITKGELQTAIDTGNAMAKVRKWRTYAILLTVLAAVLWSLAIFGCCEEKPTIAARYWQSANWGPNDLPVLCYSWFDPGCDVIYIGGFENN